MQSKAGKRGSSGPGEGEVFLLNGVGRQGFPRRWDLEQGPPGREGVSVLLVKMPLSQGGKGSGRWWEQKCAEGQMLWRTYKHLQELWILPWGRWRLRAERWSNVTGCDWIGSLCVTNRLQGKRRNWQFQPPSCQMTRLRWGWRQRGAKGCWTYSKAKTFRIFFRFQVECEWNRSIKNDSRSFGLSLFQRLRSREI